MKNAISPYSNDDLESLPHVPKHIPKAGLSDSYAQLCTPATVQSIPYTLTTVQSTLYTPKTKLQFSSGELQNSTDSDSESYQSAVSEIKLPKRKHRLSDKSKRSSNLIQYFPKGLYFEGKSNWETFKEKFKKCSFA